MEQGGGSGGEMAEEASPISTRPPANFEELMRFSAAADEGGGGSNRGGGGGGEGGGGSSSSSSGNRWPREETLALLRIRSDMDSIFRDATLKAPLWEDVSRKLWELGYKRSAKKCKEKFENVQKYYKRTKETRGGRQDGKTYKFFTQLEALTTTITSPATAPATATLDVSPLSVANPIQPPGFGGFPLFSPPPHTVSFASTPMITPSVTPPAFTGVTFSSHSSSTASGMGSDEDTDMDIDATNVAGPSSRKRKRGDGSGGGKMMEFFEGLMKQVLHKQSVMQRSFLDALEKREQERLEREEAWKRQEMARLAQEQELMAQERAASASRDAAIVSLIQKITGHTIHLPPSLTQPQRPPQPPPPPQQQSWPQKPPVTAPKPAQSQQITYHSQMVEPSRTQAQSQPIMAIPEQQIPPSHSQQPPQQIPPEKQQETGGSGVSEQASSSRWPKAEVLTLISLRSGMEPRYQDNTPKGPLWEEIAAGMRRVGYNRNAKRCKEKWENINKYYKKVKESNKKRPEDAKTCPYFHQLDELYRNKVLGNNTSTPSSTQQQLVTQGQTSTQKDNTETGLIPPLKQLEGINLQAHASASSLDNKNGEKPEDLVRELMQEDQEVVIGEFNKIEEEPQNYENDEEDEEEEDEEELDDEEKAAAYEIAFQRSTSRGSKGHSESTFLTMVQ